SHATSQPGLFGGSATGERSRFGRGSGAISLHRFGAQGRIAWSENGAFGLALSHHALCFDQRGPGQASAPKERTGGRNGDSRALERTGTRLGPMVSTPG